MEYRSENEGNSRPWAGESCSGIAPVRAPGRGRDQLEVLSSLFKGMCSLCFCSEVLRGGETPGLLCDLSHDRALSRVTVLFFALRAGYVPFSSHLLFWPPL
jgi:hypothetical protein